ncbi:dienelactone hydrolase family protein [Serratia ureilytica]
MLPAYVAKPADQSGPFPIVLVVQEIFGVHEHIQDLCRRRQAGLSGDRARALSAGDANDYTDIGELFQQLVTKVPDRRCCRIWITRRTGLFATAATPASWRSPVLLGGRITAVRGA